jgi:hypothetical protein
VGSIGNFTWSMKKYTFRGPKGKNSPPESKNGILIKKTKTMYFFFEFKKKIMKKMFLKSGKLWDFPPNFFVAQIQITRKFHGMPQ